MDKVSNFKAPKGKKHALVMPVSLQAHIAGILRLSIELAKRGVTVTFVAQKHEITLLKASKELQELDFNLVSYSDFLDFPPDRPPVFHFLESVEDLFKPIRENLLDDRKAGLPGPTCVIGDRFLDWVLDTAKELDIPYYQFDSGGAMMVRVVQAYPKMFADGTLTTEVATEGLAKGKRLMREFDGKMKISGVPALEHGEMLNSFLGIDFYIANGNAMGKSDGVIVNSFYELEAPAIDAIQQFWVDNPPPGKIPRMFLIGPISTAGKIRSFVGDQDVKGTDCLQWLDGQPPRSVVYFSLGSIAQFTLRQIKELALAVEASEQRFLWVMKKGSEEALPSNFEERLKEKVLIVVGWVPQLHILQHASIGGYVTHCGWNSITESVASGVPMACWPQLKNDQFFNCRYLVDVLKIAVELKPREVVLLSDCTSPITKNEEFETAVRRLMSTEEGNAMRSRVRDLQKYAVAAVADGGASKKALDDLVQSIPPGKM